MTTIETHTIDEALAKFDLVNGVGNGQDTACVMSAISWVAGEAFGDAPSCAHPALRCIAIGANDHPDTTPEQRAEILKAGEFGLIDTWWVPTEVIVAAMSPGPVAWPSCSRCGVELRRAGASGWRAAEGGDLKCGEPLEAHEPPEGWAPPKDERTAVEKVLAVLGALTWWKEDKQRPGLAGAYLAGARGNQFTKLPKGWKVDEATGLIVKADEVTA